jgi:hypothetical protein
MKYEYKNKTLHGGFLPSCALLDVTICSMVSHWLPSVSLFLSCPIGDELLRPAAVQPGTPTPPFQDWESHRDRTKETQMEKEK